MGREIKFRAWDNKNKKWLCGYEYPNLGGFSLFGETVLCGEWGGAFSKFIFEKDGLKWNDLIVMQYTGLKDKEGNEIYEGDIMAGYPHGTAAIRYNTEYACFETYWNEETEDEAGEISLIEQTSMLGNDLKDCFDSWVVAGNIYKNPELLAQ